MLRDDNYMSYLSDEITLDPVLKYYLSLSRHINVKHLPAKGDVDKKTCLVDVKNAHPKK